MQPKALNIKAACQIASIGRSSLYVAISRGELQAHKMGTRTIILTDDLEAWLNSLPRFKPSR